MKALGCNNKCKKCGSNNAPKDKVAGFFLCESCRRTFVTVFKNQVDEWVKNIKPQGSILLTDKKK